MNPWRPKCPFCGPTEVVPVFLTEEERRYAKRDGFVPTHECMTCHHRLIVTPPAGEPAKETA